jgi:hypothetical protein
MVSPRSVPAALSRRKFLAASAAALAATQGVSAGQQRRRGGLRPAGFELPPPLSDYASLNAILGRVTQTSATLSLVARDASEVVVEWGDRFSRRSAPIPLTPGEAAEHLMESLAPGKPTAYRLLHRPRGTTRFVERAPAQIQTARKRGEAFTFTIQGDSHPERPQMSDAALYARTLQSIAQDKPDLHICMGDDFSISKLDTVTQASVASRYLLQRPFLGLVGCAAPVFLINGNHEQASRWNYNQPGKPRDAAVFAQLARNALFPLPAPDKFYSGNETPLDDIGLLRDYCAWTWGDALFVILDNYWHSPVAVDTTLGEDDTKGKRGRDLWGITIGDAQYAWLRRTLESSRAKFKFVLAHHVLGTGRGGVERARLFEWGDDRSLKQHRPEWDLPIHQLMVKHGVTIFFQGHDHLFARQSLDGLVYQEVPVPADPNYAVYNDAHYTTGEKLANSGYLRVHVGESVRVEYVRSYLEKDESPEQKHGAVAHQYEVKAR